MNSLLAGLDAYRKDVDKELGKVISSEEDSQQESVSQEDITENSPLQRQLTCSWSLPFVLAPVIFT